MVGACRMALGAMISVFLVPPSSWTYFFLSSGQKSGIRWCGIDILGWTKTGHNVDSHNFRVGHVDWNRNISLEQNWTKNCIPGVESAARSAAEIFLVKHFGRKIWGSFVTNL